MVLFSGKMQTIFGCEIKIVDYKEKRFLPKIQLAKRAAAVE
jgi:hypothetical protein